MNKQIEVRLNGLNELGVKEINEFYAPNIKVYGNNFPLFKIGDKIVNQKKRFKQTKSFYKTGLETYVGHYDCSQFREDGYPGPYFSLQLKHFNHEIYEVEIIETYKQIVLEK